ncbi:MAG TPA: helix-turn-helix transcriptional regulator [Rhodopila sp.]|nr:helix-turn-helix transcriptional regulator [Rhodopila sp.]
MVRNARAASYEAGPEPVIAIGNLYPSGHVHPPHQHRRAQLLHSTTGTMIVGSEHGAWVVPPLCAVWIPGGVRHDIRMVGDVNTHSVYIEPDALPEMSDRCRVVGMTPLLRSLLVTAIDLPLAYNADARTQHVMALILQEIAALAELPLSVPFPADPRLAEKCRRFLAEPTAHGTIDDWASALHMSRRSFTRLFRRQTGLSLSAWRQQACLVAALPRLLDGESVTSVALDLDYTPASFTDMFTRLLGASPRDYVKT